MKKKRLFSRKGVVVAAAQLKGALFTWAALARIDRQTLQAQLEKLMNSMCLVPSS